VGNPPGLELLEITLSGPELQFSTAAVFSVCGPSTLVTVDGEERPMWSRQVIREGQKLQVGQLSEGCRAYLAIKGGFPNV
jgi:allophanate hydrolase subunit 2